MSRVFWDELRRQREDTTVLLHQAEVAGDDHLASVLRSRLDELNDIATRNAALAG